MQSRFGLQVVRDFEIELWSISSKIESRKLFQTKFVSIKFWRIGRTKISRFREMSLRLLLLFFLQLLLSPCPFQVKVVQQLVVDVIGWAHVVRVIAAEVVRTFEVLAVLSFALFIFQRRIGTDPILPGFVLQMKPANPFGQWKVDVVVGLVTFARVAVGFAALKRSKAIGVICYTQYKAFRAKPSHLWDS